VPSKIKDDNTFFVVLPTPYSIVEFIDWQMENGIDCAFCGVSLGGGNMYWVKGESEATMVKLIWG
jgi:hypothetical protein